MYLRYWSHNVVIEINNLAIEAIEIDHDTSLTKFSSPEYGVHAYIIGPTFVNITSGQTGGIYGS